MSDKFWMVWVSGTESTKKQYENKGVAITEAERLSNQMNGKTVYLLESVAVCSIPKQPVEWKEIT